MPIRVHTVDTPLLTPPAPTSQTRAPVDARRVGDDLLTVVRSSLVVVGPLTPRSTVDQRNGPPSTWSVEAGAITSVTLTIRNLQPSLMVVSPALRPLRSSAGTEWSPTHRIAVEQRLLRPGATTGIDIELRPNAAVPPGTYDGSLCFLGSSGSIPLRIVVGDGSSR